MTQTVDELLVSYNAGTVFLFQNLSPAEPGYALKKPTDLDLNCLQYLNLYQQP